MRKFAFWAMLVLCVALLAVLALIKKDEDDTAPNISVPDTAVTYTEGTSKETLLEGVTAYDDVDGDVTDSLRIETISPLENNTEAVVTYIARDSSNNIAVAKRTVGYEASEEEAEAASDADASSTEEAQETEASETETPETETPETETAETEAAEMSATVTEVNAADEEAAALAAAQEAIAALPEGSPQLVLSATQVVISAGDTFTPLNYVKSISDDEDTESELYRRIRISGSYDTDTAGTYELTYVVTDTDSNSSNTATLTLIVQ